MKRFLAFILCLLMLTSSLVIVSAAETETTATNDEQIVVAYFNVTPSTYPGSKDFTNIDVLNYHPAHIEASAMGYAEGNAIITHNYSAQLDSWKQKAYAQNPDIKFVFTVANGNISVFESWFTSLDRARRLAKEMLSIIETYGFDGLDIDYEFPQGGSNTKRYYVQFMKSMREGFDALSAENGKEYILSMAVPAGDWAFSLFDMPELAKYVSYFNIMSYDLHVGNATKNITHHHTNPCADPTPGFEGGSVEEDIALYREMGIPDDKIVVGIGMYGRRWTNVPNVNNGLYQSGTLDETTNEAYLHYSVIKSAYENKKGYVKYWDDVAKAPYLYNAEQGVFITYDDEQSAEIKCNLAASEGVRGVMVFDYVTTDNIGFFDKVQTWLDEGMHTHVYTSEITAEPTCGAEGVTTYTCECGDSYTEAIAATGEHSYVPATTEPTCGADGSAVYTCSVCGHSYSETIPATGEHNYSDWTVDIYPTYDSTGWEYAYCSVCGTSTGRDIPVLEYVNPFKDVKESHWFYDAVEFCVKSGIVKGMTEDTFAPNKNLTRAEFLMMLAKADGADLTQYENTDSGFEDVRPNHWFNEVVCWAVENGYTSGLSETKFGPNNNITRAQLARFFYVYFENNGKDVSDSADLSAFTDAGKVQSWAEVSVKWAVARGFISGVKEGVLDPNGNATRAQAARIMMLVCEADFSSADPLVDLFAAYTEQFAFFPIFEDINEVNKYELLDWARLKVEDKEFTADDVNMIYTYTYRLGDINSVLKSYLGIELVASEVVGMYGGDSIEVTYDEEGDRISVIFYGGFGYGGPSPVYDGYEQIDETHFVISFSEVDVDWKGQLDVELVDGNYIVTAKRYI